MSYDTSCSACAESRERYWHAFMRDGFLLRAFKECGACEACVEQRCEELLARFVQHGKKLVWMRNGRVVVNWRRYFQESDTEAMHNLLCALGVLTPHRGDGLQVVVHRNGDAKTVTLGNDTDQTLRLTRMHDAHAYLNHSRVHRSAERKVYPLQIFPFPQNPALP